jgi:cyanate lyase
MRRDQVTEDIKAARLARGLTWADLAERLGKPPIWVTAALLGQHPLTIQDATTVIDVLGLDPAAAPVLTTVPTRGADVPTVPTDPTIYRFYEALQVYGPAIKELIHEQFGDGIMSAINFGLTIERREHTSGDRVVVTFDGKFLAYEWPAN